MAYYVRFIYSGSGHYWPASLPLNYKNAPTFLCETAMDVTIVIGRGNATESTWLRITQPRTGPILANDDPDYREPEVGDIILVLYGHVGYRNVHHHRVRVMPAGLNASDEKAAICDWQYLDNSADFRDLAARIDMAVLATLT